MIFEKLPTRNSAKTGGVAGSNNRRSRVICPGNVAQTSRRDAFVKTPTRVACAARSGSRRRARFGGAKTAAGLGGLAAAGFGSGPRNFGPRVDGSALLYQGRMMPPHDVVSGANTARGVFPMCIPRTSVKDGEGRGYFEIFQHFDFTIKYYRFFIFYFESVLNTDRNKS